MSVYSAAVLADSPAAYWRLGELSGTNANDEGTNNLDGTYTGSFTLGVAGAIREADTGLGLPGGTGNYVTVPDANSLDFGGTMTFECWVKRAVTGTNQGLISKTGTNGPRLILASSNRFAMTRNGTVIVTSSTTLTDTTTWHHLVMTCASSTNFKLYIDSIDVTGTPSDLALSSTNNVLLIGASLTNSQSLNGSIDEVAVYPTVLSAAQVLNHYNLGRVVSLSDTATLSESAAVEVQTPRSDSVTVSDALTATIRTIVGGHWNPNTDIHWSLNTADHWQEDSASHWQPVTGEHWPPDTEDHWS